jgi:hypothetical protein
MLHNLTEVSDKNIPPSSGYESMPINQAATNYTVCWTNARS